MIPAHVQQTYVNRFCTISSEVYRFNVTYFLELSNTSSDISEFLG